MKKITLLLFVCLLALCLLSACGDTLDTTPSPDTTPSADVTTADPSLPKPLPGEGVLSYRKENGGITVSVNLPDCGGEEVSLLLLTDLNARYSWWEDPSALSAMGQLKLSKTGEGDLTLVPKEDGKTLWLLLTSSTGSYSLEVTL